ncbi:MAG: cupin domain-containing protein [Kiritimatiellia bacterium]|jgi:transcriptional regulator with XRE-family HTH domain
MSDKNQDKLGERIRMYRERLEMDEQALAAKAGVGVDVVRAVESGDVYPALGVLVKLSRALGQRLGTFMDDQFTPDPIVVRHDKRTEDGITHKKAGPGPGFHYYPLGRGKTDRHIDPFYIEIDEDAPAALSSHEGEELIIVVSGEVELVYGQESQILKPGDSAFYNSVVKHIVRSHNGPATIYAAIFVPF